MLILLIHQHVLSPVMHAKAIPLLKIKELYNLKSSSLILISKKKIVHIHNIFSDYFLYEEHTNSSIAVAMRHPALTYLL